ncbi:FecR family protein [Chitinophaga silvatica]|uniref:FecR family protein n=1 Tax=Chitinophaga silvatica TaxID=2282649 RepID=A0A3E1YH30_9BACT|nr:FecR family protein [Chitinophaga silvatica]RFS26664.1 FecR family protein [Chitinophaga silvatica]
MDIGKIRKYLIGLNAGTLTQEEESWIVHFLENATEAELLQIFPEEEWEEQIPVSVSTRELNRAYAKVAPMKVAWWNKPIIKISAAAAVLGIAVSIWSLSNTSFKPFNTIAETQWKTISTKAGENLIVYLPDSSKIYINGGSQLMYPEKFAGPIREVKLLEGEIFLDIAGNAQAPFKVKTGNVNIKVLGTSFNVRNYKVEGLTDIAVKSGKIAVSNSGNPDSVLLTPGRRIVISETTGNSLLTDTDLRAVDGWTQNEFVFNDMMLKDVFRHLEYKYGLTFEIKDTKILNKHIKAVFRDKSRWEIVDLLSKMLNFQYQVKDSLVIIQ